MDGTLPDVVDEGRRVWQGPKTRVSRFVCWVASPSCSGLETVSPSPSRRTYEDLDFATARASAKACTGLLRELGYEPHVPFNALHGSERLLFVDQQHARKADVFVALPHVRTRFPSKAASPSSR